MKSKKHISKRLLPIICTAFLFFLFIAPVPQTEQDPYAVQPMGILDDIFLM